jgi:NADH-quinone oxidoreductase subunit K
MVVLLTYFLKITILLFFIGIFGLVLNRRNILIALVSLELLLLSVNLNFIIFSIYLDDTMGQLFVLFVLTIAAAESGLGLAILVAFYKLRNSIEFKLIKINNLKV